MTVVEPNKKFFSVSPHEDVEAHSKGEEGPAPLLPTFSGGVIRAVAGSWLPAVHLPSFKAEECEAEGLRRGGERGGWV